jgi:hypothetical protein
MTRGLRTSPLFIGLQLTAGRSERVSHGDVDILMGVIQLRVVRDLHIQPGKMEANGNVIEVTLMMVSVPTLYHHFAPHDVWRKAPESL